MSGIIFRSFVAVGSLAIGLGLSDIPINSNFEAAKYYVMYGIPVAGGIYLACGIPGAMERERKRQNMGQYR